MLILASSRWGNIYIDSLHWCAGQEGWQQIKNRYTVSEHDLNSLPIKCWVCLLNFKPIYAAKWYSSTPEGRAESWFNKQHSSRSSLVKMAVVKVTLAFPILISSASLCSLHNHCSLSICLCGDMGSWLLPVMKGNPLYLTTFVVDTRSLMNCCSEMLSSNEIMFPVCFQFMQHCHLKHVRH